MIECAFSQIEEFLDPGQPGLYTIHLHDGTGLKVGISDDLRSRLIQHRQSLDSRLRPKPGRDPSDPDGLLAKGSILAKHLYFDEEIAPDYDLRTQLGRRQFLEKCCVVRFEPISSSTEAHRLEKELEASGQFRYIGRVLVRPRPDR